MKIGVIGIGNIAQKAYLPVLTTRADLEIVLCSRNSEVLEQVAAQYRIAKTVNTVEGLIAEAVEAAFVHTATESHVAIVTMLLENKIPVYVDKPLAYTYEDALKLVELSEKMGTSLMVGFNRRFAPMISQFGASKDATMISLQKNRLSNLVDSRFFIFDDFIHVVDTLRYLVPGDIQDSHVIGHKQKGLLYQVQLTVSGEGYLAQGLMNRDSGVNEEILERISSGEKWRVKNLVETIHYAQGIETRQVFGDWETTLFRRGFPQIIDYFLHCVRERTDLTEDLRDALKTHGLCEEIVRRIEA